jgi:mRNA-degrading endonuclease RelE of RelBE toxin-antitoxin system
MTYAVVFRKAPLRKLASLPVPERRRLFAAINRLAEDPAAGTPLKGKLGGLFRLRVGD